MYVAASKSGAAFVSVALVDAARVVEVGVCDGKVIVRVSDSSVAVDASKVTSFKSAWTRSLLKAVNPKRVVVFDALDHAGCSTINLDIVNAQPPYVRCLKTRSAPEHLQLKMLSAPNMIDGIGADILSYCEMFGIEAYLVASLMEAEYGRDSLSAATLLGYTKVADLFPPATLCQDMATIEKRLTQAAVRHSSNQALFA